MYAKGQGAFAFRETPDSKGQAHLKKDGNSSEAPLEHPSGNTIQFDPSET